MNLIIDHLVALLTV